MPLISLQVSEDIATKIRFLAESGVFAMDTGNVSLNFSKGELKSIKTERYCYPQVYPQAPVEGIDIVKITPIL